MNAVSYTHLALPFAELYEEGLRGIVFDIDNTLVPPDAPADERSRELVRRLRALGFRICLVSNNRGPRVQSFAEELGLPFVAKALKPRRYGYRRAMRIMRTRPEETVSVGDQLFTDIWGANRDVYKRQIPNTGITLPFISYGGTSVLFLMVEMGLVLSVSHSIRADG